MTVTSQPAEATLLYDHPVSVGSPEDTDALRTHLERLGLVVDAVEREAGRYVLFSGPAVQVLLVAVNTPLPQSHFAGVLRPAVDGLADGAVADRLANHRSHMTVVVQPQCTAPDVPQAYVEALVVHIADHISSVAWPDLVFLSKTDMLYTLEEFEMAVAGMTDTTGTMDRGPALDPSPDTAEVTTLHASARAGHLRGSPDLNAAVSDWFTTTGPKEADRQAAEERAASERELIASPAGNATVYVMSVTLIVLAFPVGLGVLVFNLFTGGSFLMTARTMALTGVGMAGHSAAQASNWPLF